MLGRVTWVGLFVRDVEALARFYGDLLGLARVAGGAGSAIFALPGGTLLELVPGGVALGGPGRKDRTQQSVQIGLAVDDLDAARTVLETRGVEVGETQTFDGGWRWARVVDPEGNVLQLVQQGSGLAP